MRNMLKIMEAELTKYRYTKAMKVSIVTIFLYGFICAIPVRSLIEKFSNIEMGSDTVKRVFGYNACFSLDYSSIFMFILPFLVIHFFTSEFTKKTIKNTVGLGINKTNIFIGKYVAFFMIIILLFLLWGFFSTLLFTIVNGWGVRFSLIQIVNIIIAIFKMAIVQLAYATFPIILSFVIYNSAVIVAVLFGSSLGGSVIISFISRINSNLINAVSFIFPDRYMLQFIQVTTDSKILLGGILSIIFNILLTIGISITLFRKANIYI